MIFVLVVLIVWLGWYVKRMRARLMELTERVSLLEGVGTPVMLPPAEPVVEREPEPVFEPLPAPASSASPVIAFTEPVFEEAVSPGPTLSERLRGMLGGMLGNQEWEMLVGGNLLNKLGALVLVIGIALFLGYSFEHVTPAGRASIAAAISLAALGAGVRLERRGRYQIFAGGLIGAGWAALYATSYAMYAIPAARVISNPLVGSLLVVAVAAGMIWHSLRYRSQAVTAVAYFAAFAAMAVAPPGAFAVVGLIPLAASLLYLAWRFEWYSMALFGLAATYLTCISRGNSGASLAATQSLFLAYWLLFEAFDLLRVRKRILAGALDLIFPINTICFLGLSYLTWAAHAPGYLWRASAFGAALYLVDALARAVVRPSATFAEEEDLRDRLRAGSYEGALLVSAVLAALAIAGRVPGVWTGVGLALEAEIVYLAGLRLRSQFLRRLGARAFAVSLFKIAVGPEAPSKTVLFGSHAIWNWTPPFLFHALLFYVNRALRNPNALMSSCAAVIVTGAMVAELPIAALGLSLIVFGMLLFELGLRRNLFEFRAQACCALIAGVAAAVIGLAQRGTWVPEAFGLALMYGCAFRTKWMDALPQEERRWFEIGTSAATAALAVVLTWRLVPRPYLALAGWVLAVLILELGSRRLPSELRVFFAPLAFLATLVVVSDFNTVVKFPATSVWVSYAGICLASAAAVARFTLWPPEEADLLERTLLRDAVAGLCCAASLTAAWMVVPDPFVTILWTVIVVAVLEAKHFRNIAFVALLAVDIRVFGFDLTDAGFHPARLLSVLVATAGMYWVRHRTSPLLGRAQSWAALFPLIFVIEREAGSHNAPLGWMLVALVLLIESYRSGDRDALYQSCGVAGLAFATALFLDVQPPRLYIGGLTAAAFYGAQYLARRFAAYYSGYYSVMGTLLISALLYGQASGGLLTVSWGVQGLALLGFGFGLRQRTLRLQGLALLLICILKLFVYDLRNLETVYRILSFVVLGLILLGVSWIYSRFREKVMSLL